MRAIFTLATNFLFISIYAQTHNGLVVSSKDNSPVSFANVASFNANKQLSGTSTDLDGNFSLKTLAGDQKLLISYIGYKTDTLNIVIKEGETKNLGKIILNNSDIELKSVEVVETKPIIKISGNSINYDVENSPSSDGANLSELLQTIPGVSVVNDNKISIRGKDNPLILINGRPSTLAKSDMDAFLKSLPANSIKNIEVMTNPSAKYQASGAGMVIDITLRKGYKSGLNGSLNAGVGTAFSEPYLGRTDAGISLGKRTDKLNIYGSYNINRSNQSGKSIFEYGIFNQSDSILIHRESNYINKNLFHNFNAGLDYNLTEKSTIGLQWDGDFYNSKAQGTTGGYRNSLLLGNALYGGGSYNTYDSKRFSASAYVQKKFNKSKELDIDVSYQYSNRTAKNNNELIATDENGLFIADESQNRTSEMPNLTHTVISKIDYSANIPNWKNYTVETGLYNETNINKNPATVYDKVNDVYVYNEYLSESLGFTENIAAAYVNVNGEMKKLSFTLGLRAEQSNLISRYSNYRNNILGLFPNASLTYAFNDTTSVSFNYSRSIDRPGFWEISNRKSDWRYSQTNNNVSLLPAFVNHFGLELNTKIKGQQFNVFTGVYYTTNERTAVTYQTDSSKIYSSQLNAFNVLSPTVGFHLQLNLFKRLTGRVYAGGSYDMAKSKYPEWVGNQSYFTAWFGGGLDVRFWKNAHLGFNAWGGYGWGDILSRNKLYLGLSFYAKKSFFDDKFSVQLRLQDPTRSSNWKQALNGTDFYQRNEYINQNPYLSINFSYRFGKSYAGAKRQKVRSERQSGSGAPGGGGGM